jgi:hypothetical protein
MIGKRNLEHLDFHQLVVDKAYEFLFVWARSR